MADDTRTDPRYHAAYQRGYAGPAPERVTRAEERFRRPRRGESGRAEPAAAAPRLPERWREVRVPAEPAEEPPAVASLLAEPPLEDAPEPDDARPEPAPSAVDTRLPLVLASMGALLVVIGAALLWTAAGWVYYDNGTEAEQFARALLNTVPSPAITIGLISIGAAIALRAGRS